MNYKKMWAKLKLQATEELEYLSTPIPNDWELGYITAYKELLAAMDSFEEGENA